MDPSQSAGVEVLRFGAFELDVSAGELRRSGRLVRLPPQPFQVLQLLVESAGAVVDRDQIRRQVWGETTVDFDRSLNVCIAQIRTALNDEPESPRFIQTLPRRGYRFLAPVERIGERVPAPIRPRNRALLVLTGGFIMIALAAASYRLGRPAEQAVRLAVLPFDVVGVSPDNAQIEGLFDELLTRLGGVQPDRLRVIGRRSAALFRNERKPLREIGERLKVGYIVDSTVKMDGPLMRVATRLSQVEGETMIWTETFTQEADPREFEEQYVARVSAAVLAKLFPASSPLVAQQGGCREGWEAYRTGRLLANRGTISSLQKSLPFFEQADCPPSRAALAQTLTRLARIGPARPELWERARVAARGAVDSQKSAHLSLGNVAFWRDWDWKKAEQEFQAALRGNPSDPDAHHDIAWLLMALGRKEDALASLQRAIALDPLSSYINMDAAWLLLQAGRYRESAAQARRTLELDPELAEARACLSRALMYAGDDHGAMEAIRALASEDQMRALAALPPAQAIRELLRNSVSTRASMDHYQRAWRLAWIGSREEALTEVEEAFRARSSMMPLVAVDPGFSSIRGDARFRKIVLDMGL